MTKCDSKLQSNFIEITLRHACYPVNFQNTFPKNTSGRLLLKCAQNDCFDISYSDETAKKFETSLDRNLMH